jgi:hypothetical protein
MESARSRPSLLLTGLYFCNSYLRGVFDNVKFIVMCKIILLFLLAASFVSCNNNGSSNGADSLTVHKDSPFSGTIIMDSAGANEMNADTSGMSHAK